MGILDKTKLEKFNIMSKDALDNLDTTAHPNEMFATTDEADGDFSETLVTKEELNSAVSDKVSIDTVNAAFAKIEPTIVFAETERQKSKNLFDINAPRTVHGGHSFVNGTTITVEGGGSTETESVFGLIPVKENTTYYIGANASNKRLLFRIYDENKNVITSAIPNWVYNQYWKASYADFSSPEIRTQLTIPQGAKYLALQTSWQSYEYTISNVIISEYSDVENYQPYNGASTHNNDAPIVFVEEERQKTLELFNINADHYDTVSGISSVVDNSLTIKGYASYLYTYYLIDVEPFTDYTIKTDVNIVTGSIEQSAGKISIYDGRVSTYLAGVDGVNGTSKFTFNTQNNSRISIVLYARADSAGSAEVKFSNIHLQKGNYINENLIYNGAIMHEKDIADKTMHLINEVYLTNESFSSISFENLNGDDGDVFKLIVTGSANVPADGHILFNNIDSGMQSLVVATYADEGATGTAVVANTDSSCPFRVDTGHFQGELTFGVNRVYNGSFIWYDLIVGQVNRSSKANYFRHITGSLLDQNTLNRLTVYFGANAYRGTRLKLYKLGGKLVG